MLAGKLQGDLAHFPFLSHQTEVVQRWNTIEKPISVRYCSRNCGIRNPVEFYWKRWWKDPGLDCVAFEILFARLWEALRSTSKDSSPRNEETKYRHLNRSRRVWRDWLSRQRRQELTRWTVWHEWVVYRFWRELMQTNFGRNGCYTDRKLTGIA